MRIPGYCIECRKIKQVRVTRPIPGVNVQSGVCASCDRERAER